MKLKYITCPNCKTHRYSSIGFYGTELNVKCVCGHNYKTQYQFKEVNYPDVEICGVMHKELNKELEIFFEDEKLHPFGFNAEIKFHKEAGRKNHTRYNGTEFHFMFKTYVEENGAFAIESDIHSQGGTTPIDEVKSITITIAEKLHTDHYEY